MALFYSPTKAHQPTSLQQAEIIGLDYQGLGVAKIEGKTWFIENALPQEVVHFSVLENKRQYGRGTAQKWLKTSPQRQQPKCHYYARCGGCQSQHIPIAMQRQAKEQALFRQLSQWHKQIEFMPMITGEPWQYRRRIRLALRVNPKSKQLELGFRQKQSQHIVSIAHCEVVEPRLNKIIAKLTALFSQWQQPQQLGHIDLVAGDNGVSMLLRHLGEVDKRDKALLQHFAEQQQLNLFVQSDHDVMCWYGDMPMYMINDLKLQFDMQDFIQVNACLNQQMVNTALHWLELQAQDHVLDLFCGMGNFTLPLSKYVASVVGIEGVQAMVAKARYNAEQNQCHNVRFYQTDLAKSFLDQPWAKQTFNKILLDPPRAGADFALNGLCELQAEKILYVSCNPASLVRDTKILLDKGYQLVKLAMIDMFPHTGHLESISLFERQ
ncbi:23S rRNA m(5)U-1939 methyltransferase [Volucribacter psittacicida]|uniref:23S rRNA (uracil(1939)-C(5))-methyltransferase RlmD n=1 Tax=Volucribacter psittacicida TaxID=203482 RepID=A0A4R1G0U3_9PAST|nr:23S rRNA (uracil(1939)-C(5))-methyltransferase RlmD [Volucribacter psittacicida]TCJ98598.1 23S rRNA m(5)U-1939 methyltransferase [Volucribacter psittacicida]